MRNRAALGALALAIWALTGSCRNTEILALEETRLFTLEIGKLEDQIDLFQIDGVSPRHKNGVFMRDGIIYVANGNGNKVMQFTSFGDLLTLLYNPEQNPRPILLNTVDDEETLTNLRAVAFPFAGVGEVVVAPDRTILVEDRLPRERAAYDEQREVIIDRVVRRFSADGEYLDYIGREGVGGTPFPYIAGLSVSDDGRLTVVSRVVRGWLVYRFSPEGDLVTSVDISLDRLPVPEGEDVIPSLQNIVADRDEPLLYLMLYYYPRSAGTAPRFDVESMITRIYVLDLTTGRYERFIEVPRNRRVLEGDSVFDREEVEYAYELVDAAPGNHLFLLSHETETRTQLLILRSDGTVVRRRYLTVDEDDILFREFDVSPQGILTALVAAEVGVHVYWWRSDRLFGEQ